MLRMIVIACVASVCLGQTVQDKEAKILKEQRFNAGDGRTGAAFATENGQVFREETSADGERIGQYSYIDNDGKVITVKYSAGKDGFKILEGDHVPATGQDSAPFDPNFEKENAPAPAPQAPAARPAPAPRARVPLPARAPAPVRQQVVPAPIRQQVQESDPNRNPFINPHDPTHRDFAFNTNGAQFQPAQPVQAAQPARAAQQTPVTLDASFVPNCAGCEGLNPFVNPFDESHGGRQVNPNLIQVPRAQVPAPRPFVPQPVAPVQPALQQDFDGQIKINRFETGFNFDFQA
jgi:hypothetical protein